MADSIPGPDPKSPKSVGATAGAIRAPKVALNEELVRAMREMGVAATLEELKARGVTRVRHVPSTLISRMIEKAVNRTVMARTMGVSDEELRELVAGAQREFRHIVGTQDEIERTRAQVGEQRAALREELVKIRAELAGGSVFEELRESEAAAREPTAAEREQDHQLSEDIRAAFAEQLTQTPGSQRLQHQVIELVLAAMKAARRSAFEAGRQKSREEVQALERRVAKLVASLDMTEEVLKRVAAMKDVEFGIASIYRDVQGLNPDEGDAARKRDLMAKIFEKNLELHLLAKERAAQAAAQAS